MKISVLVATYGDQDWADLAAQRAIPSAENRDAHEVLSVHQPDGTIATSRNALADRASGDWLCFLDADDTLAPGYIIAMEEAHKHHPGDHMLFTPAVQQIRKGPPRKPFFFPECSFTTGNWIVIGTVVSRRLFLEVGGFDEHPHGLEDWQLWAKCSKAGAEVVRVPAAVYVAHFNQRSKHHVLSRDRKAYMVAYEKARASVWG